jgi:hypothetical protein
MSMIMQNLPDTRARTDAMEELEAARIKFEQISIMQDVNRGLQAAAFCDSVAHLTRRLDSYIARRDARIRAEEEAHEREEQQHIQSVLDTLPDPDAPGPFAPSGDLHDVPPSEPAHEEQLQQSAATAGERSGDNEGDLPNELLEDVPPITGTSPEFPGSREPTARNPASFDW